MKITRWQRAVSLLLCLLIAMSFFAITAPNAYAVGPSWPQITKISVTDGYVYDSEVDPAVKAAITDYIITQYDERETLVSGQLYIVGEICLTVSEPVRCNDGAKAEIPEQLIVKAGNWSIDSIAGADMNEVKATDTAIKRLTATKQKSGEYSEVYNPSTHHTTFVTDDEWEIYSYYRFKIVIEPDSSDSVPTIKANVVNPATADATVGTAWTLNLSDIFEDKDGKALTYKVKVNDGDVVDIEGSTYRYVPSAAGTTKLTFTANNGGTADSEAYVVNLTAKTGTVAAPWPQITKISVTDGYVYDSEVDPAVKAAITDYIITQYDERETLVSGQLYIVGEICLTVSEPVRCNDGAKAEIPEQLIVKAGNWSIDSIAGADMNEVKATDTAIKRLTATKQKSGEYSEVYNPSTHHTTFVTDDEWEIYSYYRFKIVIEPDSSDSVPTIKANVVNPATADATVGTAWTLDLTTIFEDADNDALTYKVKVGDAEAVAADANYSYTPTAAGTTKLVFTSNDGKADSPEYTVTLNVTAASEETYTITAAVDGAYIVNTENLTQPMGTTKITVNGTSASEAKVGDPVMVKAIPQKYSYVKTDLYDAKFDRWEVVAGPTGLLSDAELKNAELTFDMPAATVSLKAVFVAVGSQVTLTANDFNAGDVSLMIGDWAVVASTYDFNAKRHANDSVTRTVIADAKVSAVINAGTNNAGYKLVGWEITNTTTNEQVNFDYDAGYGGIERPYFTVDGTSNYTISAIFAAKDYGNVNVTVNDESMGTATAQIGTEEAATSLIGVVEGTTVKVQAQPKPGFIFQSWSATYGDGKTVETNDSSAAQTTFVMPATNHQPVNVVATFAEDPNYLSEECVLESVLLLDHSGNTFEGDQDGTAFTVTLPADADASNLVNMVLKLTYSKNAKVFRDGDTTAWDVNGQSCNMTLGTVTKFVVRSQKDLAEGNEGPTREYTITIQKAASPDTPTLSNGSATRTSKTGATVKFTSSEAGNYFYKVVDHGATAPTADEIMKSTTKGTASTGEITFTLSNLTEDARDIYIVVVSAAGGESAPLKVEIPAYGSGSETPDTGAYKISISAPKGGTITTNRTKADKGDEIIVTVTPDNGYQMVSGSLTYTLAKEGGETKTITNNRFTMPAGDVSITCKWETATTTAKGITSFSINGVAGAVNNSTNTITITMPRGTDVTKLTPVIATNGVKSLTPGNGVTVDFTNAVTYTAAMEDGSSKTYTVTVYVDKGTLADQFWDKLTDFANQVPWWQYAEKQQSTSKYPKYW